MDRADDLAFANRRNSSPVLLTAKDSKGIVRVVTILLEDETMLLWSLFETLYLSWKLENVKITSYSVNN